MNAKILSLSALLLASVATSALAQDGDPMARGAREQHGRGEAGQAAGARAPQQAPPSRDGRGPEQGAGPRGGRPDRGQPEAARGPDAGRNPDVGRGAGGDGRRDFGPRDNGPRAEGPRERGPRDGARPRDRNAHEWSQSDRNRYERGPRDDDRGRSGWERRDGARWDDDRRDRDWDRGRPDAPRWARDRYPPIYNSPSRYRGVNWRPPSGYYVRAWRYNEVLPRGWYGPEYRLADWWRYDLPRPPYGFDWVRVGPDVLLVDGYSGRIVQVVRSVFW